MHCTFVLSHHYPYENYKDGEDMRLQLRAKIGGKRDTVSFPDQSCS